MLREATSADIPILVGFVVEEAREAQDLNLDPAMVAKSVGAMFDDPTLGRYWVAETGGDVVGAIAVVREWSDWRNAAYWWIQFVYVRPAARGTGIVDSLVDHVRALASASPEVRLYVHHENARAIRAYERLGFRTLPYRIMGIAPKPTADAGELDDDAVWAAFHARTLPSSAWTHVAHVRIAWMHLARYEIDEAHIRMRVGIIRLNASHGLVETAQRGYHETITRAWLAIVREARARDACTDSRALIAAHSLGRDTPLRYYSKERLMSVEARASFVAPDLAQLP
jgi:ribosomal protein S18 acetylase RimI-like enzyme